MAKFDANNPKKPENKIRSGQYKTNKIKTAEFIPSVFQTDTNKKWLDATLDQLVSKASLENIDGFIGDRSGRTKSKNDSYVSEPVHASRRQSKQLSPAIVNKDVNGEIFDRIGVDDIANSVATNFDSYAYNAAYSSQSYTFSPPIDIDKFLNHTSYYWMYDMPVYDSTNIGKTTITGDGEQMEYKFANSREITVVKVNGVTKSSGTDFVYSQSNTVITFLTAPALNASIELTGAATVYTNTNNPVLDLNNSAPPTFVFADDDNEFELQNGILIRFGLGYSSDIEKSTYIVTGVGTTICLKLYNKFDTTFSRNIPWWVDYSTYKKIISDFWDPTTVTEWNYKLNGSADSRPTDWGVIASPANIISEYNAIRTASDWVSGNTYAIGDRAKYTDGKVYKCNTLNSDVTFDSNNWDDLGAPRAMCRFFNGTLGKNGYLTNGDLIRVGSDWPSLGPQDQHEVYMIDIDSSGLVSLNLILGAKVKENITAITNANPARITTESPHGFTVSSVNGAPVSIRMEDISGMVDGTTTLNFTKYFVKVVDSTNIELYTTKDTTNSANGLDTSSWSTYTSGGFLYNAPDGNLIEQYIPVGLTQEQSDIANGLIGEWDTDVWDRKFLAEDTRDYHVVSTNDNISTQWSRGNWWVHKETVLLMETLIPTFSSKSYLIPVRQARRPILEFKRGLYFWEHENNPKLLTQSGATSRLQQYWHGPIDFLIKEDAEVANMSDGSRYIKLLDNKIYVVTNGTGAATGEIFDTGDTCLILNSPAYKARSPYDNVTLVEKYRNHDVYFDGTTFQIGQHKKARNQAALYRLWDFAGVELENATKYPASTFAGNKIFGYQVGTGTNDIELGFPLVYKDVSVKADYSFENYLHTLVLSYPVESSAGAQIGVNRTAEGMFSFAENGEKRHIYKPSMIPLGAKDTVQYEIEQKVVNAIDMVAGRGYTIKEVGTSNFTLFGASSNTKDTRFTASAPGAGTGKLIEDIVLTGIGYDDWRTGREFLVYRVGDSDTFSVANRQANGIISERRKKAPTLILRTNTEYDFHDLIDLNTLQFYEDDRQTLISTTFTNNTYKITTPSTSGSVIYYGYSSNTTKGKIICVADEDYLYHTLYVNGKELPVSSYDVATNTITLPGAIQSEHNIIDVDYYNNDTSTSSTNTQVSDTHKHNSANKVLETLTITETLKHWKSLLLHTPNFTGESFGFNNYHKTTQVDDAGGEIFMHNDISIMHDLNYANDSINIQESLFNQANDYWSFKRRFMNQISRIYTTGNETTVKGLVNKALKEIAETRKGQALHKHSNMVYWADDKYEKLDVGSSLTLLTSFSPNKDRTQCDHLYVYLTENIGGKMIERLLVKDNDYTIDGAEITLSATPTALNSNSPAFLTLYWNSMDYACNIPASMTKLGVSLESTPRVRNGQLWGHDGSKHEYTSSKELYDMDDTNFDVITACLFDLEKRIFAGLSFEYDAKTALKYLPSQHRPTWYTLETVNAYTKQMFSNWQALTGNTELNTPNYYDSNDDKTWNYSSILIGEHLSGNTLPGHWIGAYLILFGTYTPHLTPWHMLGISKKPQWWDTHYPNASSWDSSVPANNTKINNLIKSLQTGIITEPNAGETYRQDLAYARYYWDWTNKFPVNISSATGPVGALRRRRDILGTPASINAQTKFKYGDFGPVELEWRESALGQSALIDAALKLSPTQAWTDFFQPGSVNYTGTDLDINKPLYYNGKNLINPRDIIYTGKGYGSKVHSIVVRSSTTGFGDTSTIELIDGYSKQKATAKLNIDSTGTITNVVITDRGVGLTGKPIIEISNTGAGSDQNARADLEIFMTANPERTNGLNEIQQNNLDRNFSELDLEGLYYTIETRLMHKMAGFTSKNLVDFYVESGKNGEFRINENDFDLLMYSGKPSDILTASNIIIKKTGNEFYVSGFSANKQRFVYQTVKVDNNYSEAAVTLTSSLRKYKNFGEVTSIDFGQSFTKVQDLYDFIRGSRKYLEDKGITFQEDMDAVAMDAIRWAIGANPGDDYVCFVGNTVSYKSDHGYILPLGSLPYGANDILDDFGREIATQDYKVDRTYDVITVTVDEDKDLGAISFAEIDFEHVAVFDNRTDFNDTIFDEVMDIQVLRLKLQGDRTKDWDGNRRAPGYLIFENKIVENWDSSVQTLDDFYNFNINNVNDGVQKAESLMLGEYGRDWYSGTNLSQGTLSNLWKGVLKDKGTSGAATKYLRGDLVYGGNSNLQVREEWMFRNSHMGNITNVNAHELQLRDIDITNNKQVIDLSLTPDRLWVNNKSSNVFDVISYDQYINETRFKTAGEVLNDIEVKFKINTIDDINNIYTKIIENNEYETWNNQISYKMGEKVRYNGKFYNCITDSVGFTTASSNVTVTGSRTNPIFDYASQANGDSASAVITSPVGGTVYNIYFDTSDRNFDNIVATGTVTNPSIASGSTITINSVEVTVTNTPRTAVVYGSIDNGNPSVTTPTLTNPVISDNTGKTLIINGNTINLFDSAIPAGSTLDRQDIVDFINDSDPSGDLTATEVGSTIKILYDVNSDATKQLVIGAGTANSDLGIAGATYSPALQFQNVTTPMTAQVFADKLNDGDYTPTIAGLNLVRIVASVSGNQLVITKQPDSNSSTGDYLNISGTAATAAGLPLTTGPITFTDIPRASNVSEVRDFINAENIPGVTASTSNNRLIISSTQPSIDLGLATNEMNDKAGIQGGSVYQTSVTVANEFQPTLAAGEFKSGRKYEIVTIGTTDYTLIGASSNTVGVTFIASGAGSGTGTSKEINWEETSDPLTTRIQLVNDNGISNLDGLTGSVQSKFNSWNVLQIQNLGWYTGVHAVDTDGTLVYDSLGNPVYTTTCSICAGTSTADGNDACVNIHPSAFGGVGNVRTSLEIGDYVMIVNSDSKPSIDGIHKVTALGNENEVYKFFIDMFIEECGSSAQVYVLRNNRFETLTQLQTATSLTTHYKFNTGDYAWLNYEGNPQVRGTYVYTYDGTNWNKVANREVLNRATNTKLESILIYDGKEQQTQIELEVYDPVLGILPGIADREISSKDPVDQAVYTHSTSLNDFTEANERNAWGENELGYVWWDTSKVVYYDYSQGSDDYLTDYWGKLFTDSLSENQVDIHVYEWTKSKVAPDEWETAVEAQSDQFGLVATGIAYSVYDPFLNENIFYYSQLEEYNPKTGDYDNVYYFWVRSKTNYPQLDTRNISTRRIESILTDPTAEGIPWCAAVGEGKFIIANVGNYLSSRTVLQINKILDTDISRYNKWRGSVASNGYAVGDMVVYSNSLYRCKTANSNTQFNYDEWDLIVGTQTNSAHEGWSSIVEGKGLISEYWYKGLIDNLIGEQQSLFTDKGNQSKIRFPNQDLHIFNRYGDDRYLGQGWYIDTFEARREAVFTANSLLKNMNLYTDLNGVWDKHIGSQFHASDIEAPIPNTTWVSGTSYGIGNTVYYKGKLWTCVVANSDSDFTEGHWTLTVANPTYLWNNTATWESSATKSDNYKKNDVVKYQNFVYQYVDNIPSVPSSTFLADMSKWKQIAVIQDMTRMWEYTTYVHPDRLSYQNPSLTVNRKSDLDNIDGTVHNLVEVKIRNNGVDLDELVKWTGTEWLIVEKRNATIKFNETIWKKGGWDSESWDTVLWDTSGDIFTYYFVKALREDIFINQFKDNFNLFFFAMVKYCLATQRNLVDWVYKTTYVQLDLETKIDSNARLYRKNGLNELVGYVESIKPFHTKVRTIFDRHSTIDSATVEFEEMSINKEITIHLNEHDVNGGSYEKTERSEPYGFGSDWTELAGLSFTDSSSPSIEYAGTDFTDATTPTEELTETFMNAQMYNERNTTYIADVTENMKILVITNESGSTVNTNSRTLVYLQDNESNTLAYSLQDSKQDSITAEFTVTDTEVEVTDGTKFNAGGGYAYIGGEIIRYGQVIGNNLKYINREQHRTSSKTYDSATKIIDITDSRLTLMNRIGIKGNNTTASRFNDVGKKILDTSSVNLLPQELQSGSQGIEF